MSADRTIEHIPTVVIGGGQAGLVTGYHLQRLGLEFAILDANERVGDSWRNRWDSLRLFTPAKFNGLDGLRFPAAKNATISKNQMADYLEQYASHFSLPVRNATRVNAVTAAEGEFRIETGDRTFTADQVIVAMGNHQCPRVPSFATELAPQILQMHSSEYRSPSQLRPGPTLVVGAGNSGAEIAKEVSSRHPTLLAGRDVGQLPFRVDSALGSNVLGPMVIRGLFHHVLTVRTPMGRRMRPSVLAHSGPLIRVKSRELRALGVDRVPRMVGVEDGMPALEGGRVVDAANVIWCTGYHPGFSWLHLPAMDGEQPVHRRGVAPSVPGLYFVGLEFQFALSSEMVYGVKRDARYVAEKAYQCAAAR